MAEPTRVDLHLKVRVKAGRRGEFLTFLREAKGYYEAPGGIEVRLLENAADDHRFIELVLYEDERAYERDQVRVREDGRMKELLARWRELLEGEPLVEVYRLRGI